jgi:hypothetical protein
LPLRAGLKIITNYKTFLLHISFKLFNSFRVRIFSIRKASRKQVLNGSTSSCGARVHIFDIFHHHTTSKFLIKKIIRKYFCVRFPNYYTESEIIWFRRYKLLKMVNQNRKYKTMILLINIVIKESNIDVGEEIPRLKIFPLLVKICHEFTCFK